MPVSKVAAATRAFVAVLLALARSYEVALTVNRDSRPDELLKAYRKLLLKTHPDKGGRKCDQQRLQQAKEHFERTRGGTSSTGRRCGTRSWRSCSGRTGLPCFRPPRLA